MLLFDCELCWACREEVILSEIHGTFYTFLLAPELQSSTVSSTTFAASSCIRPARALKSSVSFIFQALIQGPLTRDTWNDPCYLGNP